MIQHVADLLEIATSAQLPAENPLKLHAVTYLQSFVKLALKERVLENSELHFCSEQLLRLLTVKGLPLASKNQIIAALEAVLQAD